MSEGVDPRVSETIEHVQNAALELIRAMRTALDVAEDFVGDPAALSTLLHGAVAAAQTVMGTANHTAAPTTERVERIRVDD